MEAFLSQIQPYLDQAQIAAVQLYEAAQANPTVTAAFAAVFLLLVFLRRRRRRANAIANQIIAKHESRPPLEDVTPVAKAAANSTPQTAAKAAPAERSETKTDTKVASAAPTAAAPKPAETPAKAPVAAAPAAEAPVAKPQPAKRPAPLVLETPQNTPAAATPTPAAPAAEPVAAKPAPTTPAPANPAAQPQAAAPAPAAQNTAPQKPATEKPAAAKRDATGPRVAHVLHRIVHASGTGHKIKQKVALSKIVPTAEGAAPEDLAKTINYGIFAEDGALVAVIEDHTDTPKGSEPTRDAAKREILRQAGIPVTELLAGFTETQLAAHLNKLMNAA